MYFDFGSLEYIGTIKPSNPKLGDIVSGTRGENISIYNGSNWVDCGAWVDCEATTSTGPTIEYREIKPKICVRCGAPLHGYKCEYCDTEYS